MIFNNGKLSHFLMTYNHSEGERKDMAQLTQNLNHLMPDFQSLLIFLKLEKEQPTFTFIVQLDHVLALSGSSPCILLNWNTRL